MNAIETIRKAATGCGFVILGFFGIRAFIGIEEIIKYLIFGVF